MHFSDEWRRMLQWYHHRYQPLVLLLCVCEGVILPFNLLMGPCCKLSPEHNATTARDEKMLTKGLRQCFFFVFFFKENLEIMCNVKCRTSSWSYIGLFYLRLGRLPLFFALSLLEHGFSLLGPLNVPAHSQHALQRLPHWPAVRFSFLHVEHKRVQTVSVLG